MAEDDDEPATKGDLRQLQDATKDGLRKLATDLREELASKDDLRKLATDLREELASKADLRKLATDLREELASKADLRTGLESLESRMDAKMGAMERRIVRDVAGEIQRAMNIAVEQIGSRIGVVDEKYQDVPPKVAALERELGEHKIDFVLHKRPPSRKSPARKPSSRRAR